MIDSWKFAMYSLISVALNLICLRNSEGFVNVRTHYPCLKGCRYYPTEIRCPNFNSKTQIASSIVTEMDNRNDDSRRVKPQMKLPSIYVNTIGIFLLGWCMKMFTKRWLAIKAGEKFLKAGTHQLLLACALLTSMLNHIAII
jgi:hypothetical protein